MSTPVRRARLPATATDAALIDSLFSADTLGFAVFDADLRYQRVNERLAKINGIPADDHIGRTIPQVLPRPSPLVSEALRQVLDTGQSLRDMEVQGETPAAPGEKRSWNITLLPVRDPKTQGVIGVAVTVMETTERKREQARWERSERDFVALVENLPDIIARFDRSLRCTYVSPAVEPVMGLPPAFFTGKTHAEMGLPPEFCARAEESLLRVFRTGRRDQVELSLEVPTRGETRVYEGIAIPLYGPDGTTVETVMTTLRDITEAHDRDRNQRFLVELAERTRFLQDPEAVIWEVVRGCGEFLRLSRCLFADVDEAAEVVTIHRDWRRDADTPSLKGAWPLGDVAGAGAALRAGRTVVRADATSGTQDAAPWVVEGDRSSDVLASVTVPLLRGGRWVGAFAAHASCASRRWKAAEVALMETVAEHAWLTVENVRLHRDTQEAVLRQRRFLREILSSVTEGRLRLCDSEEEMPPALPAQGQTLDLTPETLRSFRLAIQEAAQRAGMERERILDLLTASGEAATNAIKHAGGGTGTVCADLDRGILQLWIQDRGAGINEEDLHRATLEPGFSSAGTLGHGFFLMLRLCDRLFLRTGAEGTTVVLEQERTPPIPSWFARV